MSSLVRRLQIRILKAKGFIRQTSKVGINGTLVPCKRVMTPEGKSIASWPTATQRPAGYSRDGVKPRVPA